MIMQQDQDMENEGDFDGDIPQEEDHKIDVTSEEMDEEEASMQI